MIKKHFTKRPFELGFEMLSANLSLPRADSAKLENLNKNWREAIRVHFHRMGVLLRSLNYL